MSTGSESYTTESRLVHADWLSQQDHKENKEEEIKGMQISVNAILLTTNVPECMTVKWSKGGDIPRKHLLWLRDYIIRGWPDNKVQLPWDIRTYLTFRDKKAIIYIVIPETLQQQALKELHINHVDTEKNQTISMWICVMGRYVCRHWKSHKYCSTCLHLQQTKPRQKIIHHDIPGKPWEVIEADMLTLNNSYYLCIVDYHSKFPIVKRAEDMSAESLILACKAIFS